ncbi:MAG: hypothetical protein DRP12_00480 [Candidatus Aenigmatarchaeota archaeon]|nr:MAG: hypothetical protein DRP12_00480 [Candidatus Aenigmarchaeota archaeon]
MAIRSCEICREPILDFFTRSHPHLCQVCWSKLALECMKARGISFHTLPPSIKYEPPMSNGTEKTEFGICDECGELSDSLKRVNGKWVCESCRD